MRFSQGVSPPPQWYPHTHSPTTSRSKRKLCSLFPRLRFIPEICIPCSHVHLFPGGWILGIYMHSRGILSPLTPGAPKVIISEWGTFQHQDVCSLRSGIVHANKTSVHVNRSVQLSSYQAKFICFCSPDSSMRGGPCFHSFPEVSGLKSGDPVSYCERLTYILNRQ